MATGACLTMLFGKKSFQFEKKEMEEADRKLHAFKKFKETNETKLYGMGDMTSDYIMMADLREKVLIFRDLIDLSPCPSSASPVELMITTVNDFHKMYPDLIPMYSASENKGMPVRQALVEFYDAMRVIGEIWVSRDELTDKSKCLIYKNMSENDLKQEAMEMLKEMIGIARERSFDMMDEDDSVKSYTSGDTNDVFVRALTHSSSFSGIKTPIGSPATPTSVLEDMNIIRYSSPLLMPLRVQAVGKLIDIRRLSFPMITNVSSLQKIKEADVDTDEYYSKIDEVIEDVGGSEMDVDFPIDLSEDPKSIENPTRGVVDALLPPLSLVKLRPMVVAPMIPTPSPPRKPSPEVDLGAMSSPSMPPPPQPPMLISPSNRAMPPPPPPPPGTVIDGPMPPPPSPLMVSRHGNGAMPPPPPPPLEIGSNGIAPPPPMHLGKGGGPPPPPPALGGARTLRPKKAATKLKRSSQMGNLYRLLKVKVEGSSLDGKSQGKKGKVGAPAGGKQGMADALAEMTKRSAYFQQIEEDVKNHAKTIAELKVSISAFQTADMTELIKFHKHVESHLEKLTDETQVLARFEGFPGKKLEALRMAAALYSKLDTTAKTLQDWKIVAPLGQLLDKTENYFNKLKVELDAIERTKDEESKKFQSHKITFDFSILLKVKELMVDVSSSCMELALQEKRAAKANENMQGESKPEGQKKGSAKTLWRAFQFAYKVYTFAGGHDDRADLLTKELAHEIECDPEH